MKTAFKFIEITPCAERLKLEARGLFGFHDSQSCPNCVKRDDGFRVHSGDSILAPFAGYYPDEQTIIGHNIYFTR